MQISYDDDAVHHPLGGAGYIFKDDIVKYLAGLCPKDVIKVRIGTQPNGSPHMGTIVTFTTGFALAKRLTEIAPAKRLTEIAPEKKIQVYIDFIDTAPSTCEKETVDGVQFQRSLRYTSEFDDNREEFLYLFHILSNLSKVSFETISQGNFLGQPGISKVIRDIISRRNEIGKNYSPGFRDGNLGIRTACPHFNCGLADKHGIHTSYYPDRISFLCPLHGRHEISLYDEEDVKKLEFNTPLRMLLRSEFYAKDEDVSWIQVTGGDYAGFYQEQLLWKHISDRSSPLIIYAPVIVDWAGSKLSKSLYVQEGAYEYLIERGMEYIISFRALDKKEEIIGVVFDEAVEWIDHPVRLFRNYSLEYLHRLILKKGILINGTSDALERLN
jgi:hypothetical protein